MKILAIDIETSPNLAYVWRLWRENVGLNQLVSATQMLCFAAKWVGEKRVLWYPGYPHPEHTDTVAMVEAAHGLLDEADVVLHYNGAKFDIPHLNREFLEHGLMPPAPYKQIDLYKVARKVFQFPSNRLAYVSKALGLEGKVEHSGFELWAGCMAGDVASWREMARYNKQDVVLLEQLYELLLPWIPSHPNRALFDHTEGTCPKCGSTNLQRRGYAVTAVSRFQRWQCQDCGGWSRTGARESGTDLREVA